MKKIQSKPKQEDQDVFVRRFRELADNSGLSREELAKAIKISKSALVHYLNGERQPKIDALTLIADYFHVSTDFLIREDVELRTRDFDLIEASKLTGISVEALEALRRFNEEDAKEGKAGRSVNVLDRILLADLRDNVPFLRRFANYLEINSQYNDVLGKYLTLSADEQDIKQLDILEEKRDAAQFRLMKNIDELRGRSQNEMTFNVARTFFKHLYEGRTSENG